ncbi:hypothetical protein ABZP36_028990 [Zizania latifolia]
MAAHGKLKPHAPPAPAPPPPPPSPPPPPEAKRGFMRRMFPFLLAANLFVGAYVLVRAYQKDSGKEDAETDPVPTSSSAAAEKSAEATVAPTPRKVLPPISEDEQRQLYKWMLEEKRKTKARNAAEKKKIDEDKALLKEFIRAESLPSL